MNNDYPQEELWTPTGQSTTQEAEPVKSPKPLNKRRKVFTKEYGSNPKQTATASAIKAGYSEKTAYSIASELLKKPEIQAELAKYEGKAEYNLMVLADKSTEYALTGTRDGAAYASVSERVNNSIIDRLRGKATQRTESVSTTVTLSLSLKDIAVDNPVDNSPLTETDPPK